MELASIQKRKRERYGWTRNEQMGEDDRKIGGKETWRKNRGNSFSGFMCSKNKCCNKLQRLLLINQTCS